ncbi:MAG: glycosyltransferase family 4 protein [Ruminococcaceae bacterium]|nr:glycosyltransferase family 4 protein [Oscillospiraceae bacterium]
MIKVINVISDANIGGAGKCVLTFLKHYDRQKFDLTVIVPKNSLLIPEIKNLNGKYIEVDGMNNKSLDFKVIKELRKIFCDIKPDIVHAHAAMSARIAAKFSGAKIVYTRHSVFEPSKTISKGLGKIINGFVNNFFSDKIIAVAEAAKDNLVKTGVDDKKIVVIKNGVDYLERYNDEKITNIKKSYGLKDEFIMTIAARLTLVKGHDYILEAVKKLKDDNLDFKLLIAGTGEYEENIRNKINILDINDKVIMLGFVSDVEKIVNITNLNLNASFGTEATSLSLLEGLSIGIPAVVSDFGGNGGVIYNGTNGFLVPTKNSGALYEKIKLIMQDKNLYNTLKKGSLEVFENEFTADKVVEKIQGVYISLKSKGEEK